MNPHRERLLLQHTVTSVESEYARMRRSYDRLARWIAILTGIVVVQAVVIIALVVKGSE